MSPAQINTEDDPLHLHVGFVGYGEVGRILAGDLVARGVARVSAYDIKLGSPHDDELHLHAGQNGVRLATSHADLAASADLIVSAVTASQAIPVAQACAAALRAGTWFLDFNSTSPGAKIRAADYVDAAGGCYVEGAVMTSVPPHRLRVPLRLGGKNAHALEPLLCALGFEAKFVSDKLGVASATRMCHSVMIKGLEALVIESFSAARAYGVEDEVIASLSETFPGMDWEKQGAYFFQRVIQHGRRRAEEVREAAEIVRETGLTPWLANGIALRQSWVANLADTGLFGEKGTKAFTRSADWRIEADAILKHMNKA